MTVYTRINQIKIEYREYKDVILIKYNLQDETNIVKNLHRKK